MEASRALLCSLAASMALSGCLGGIPDGDPVAPSALDAIHDLVFSDAVDVTGGLYMKEPAVAQHPGGRILVAGFVNQGSRATDVDNNIDRGLFAPYLFVSDDGSETWTRIDAGSLEDGAMSDSDLDFAVAPDGTLYLATLTFTPYMTNNVIRVGVSADAGDTWSWPILPIAAGPMEDRPWVEASPDGAVHVVWNNGRGIHHAVSDDRGGTWSRMPDVHADGGAGGFAIGPEGDLAVRVVPNEANPSPGAPPEGNDGVAVSSDGGETWTYHDLPGDRGWPDPYAVGTSTYEGPARKWDPVAFDAAGTLYAAWTGGSTLVLAHSTDVGVTWTTEIVFETTDGHVQYPYLAARGDGEVAASFFVHDGDTFDAHVVVVGDAIATGVHTSGVDDTAGEYYQVTWLQDGSVAGAVTQDWSDGGPAFRKAWLQSTP